MVAPPPPPPGLGAAFNAELDLTLAEGMEETGVASGCAAALPGAARLYRCLCFGLTSVSAPGREGPLAGRLIGGTGGGCAEAMMGMGAGAGRLWDARSAPSTSASRATEALKGQPLRQGAEGGPLAAPGL